jgi:hypothetical protein
MCHSVLNARILFTGEGGGESFRGKLQGRAGKRDNRHLTFRLNCYVVYWRARACTSATSGQEARRRYG